MRMTGEQLIAADRHEVWKALNDPAVLAQCIPGCQSLERDGENRFVAVAEVKIGPIGARFKGNVALSDLDAPNGYTITGSGNGGIAGSAKGGARVRLSDAPGGGTLVSYDVDAEVGGRMAQLGGPIIDATAKNLAGKFFAKFGEVVAGGSEPAAATPEHGEAVVPAAAPLGPVPTMAPSAPVAAASSVVSPAPLWPWVVALVLAVLTGFMLGRSHYHGVVALAVAVLVILAAAAGYEAGRRGGRT
ncbi:carbon monoxide dehydrogenase subunit G [Novosphingobium chloroacetimidivorans]|uniref:Carbon monoxide dehydrogenase subunit G n=1 Tax=Novosphingobium chloroacetimidivorans TaxID=1428314 RepID=A0A7W7KBP9_9SPHN|nr:carbon monoxide dehydrogenase subunit G [Novosphingobium chloroacetimidivorans]MBB4859887.1 carbon monoxide dehydrogenase subunit G [Novosphingobium chloroacetimidivorans]